MISGQQILVRAEAITWFMWSLNTDKKRERETNNKNQTKLFGLRFSTPSPLYQLLLYQLYRQRDDYQKRNEHKRPQEVATEQKKVMTNTHNKTKH